MIVWPRWEEWVDRLAGKAAAGSLETETGPWRVRATSTRRWSRLEVTRAPSVLARVECPETSLWLTVGHEHGDLDYGYSGPRHLAPQCLEALAPGLALIKSYSEEHGMGLEPALVLACYHPPCPVMPAARVAGEVRVAVGALHFSDGRAMARLRYGELPDMYVVEFLSNTCRPLVVYMPERDVFVFGLESEPQGEWIHLAPVRVRPEMIEYLAGYAAAALEPVCGEIDRADIGHVAEMAVRMNMLL